MENLREIDFIHSTTAYSKHLLVFAHGKIR